MRLCIDYRRTQQNRSAISSFVPLILLQHSFFSISLSPSAPTLAGSVYPRATYPGNAPLQSGCMRYLVRARVKAGRERPLLRAIETRTLGAGSVAEGEYLRNMSDARIVDGLVRWVEICYCPVPLQEERPYWEQYLR